MRLVAPLHERTDFWLRNELDRIWKNHFSDVPRVNDVEIVFARRWQYRLGMIALSETTQRTYIGINQLLRSSLVPHCVPVVTIAHELVRYAHGLGSPLPQRVGDPPAGSIVPDDLMTHGLAREISRYNEWVSDKWFLFHDAYQLVRNRGAARLRVDPEPRRIPLLRAAARAR